MNDMTAEEIRARRLAQLRDWLDSGKITLQQYYEFLDTFTMDVR